MTTHNIKYEGLDFEISGDYEKPEEETGYKGSFSWMSISINDAEISSYLKDWFIEKLIELVVEENY